MQQKHGSCKKKKKKHVQNDSLVEITPNPKLIRCKRIRTACLKVTLACLTCYSEENNFLVQLIKCKKNT